MERSPELAGEFTAPADRKLVRTTEEEAAKQTAAEEAAKQKAEAALTHKANVAKFREAGRGGLPTRLGLVSPPTRPPGAGLFQNDCDLACW